MLGELRRRLQVAKRRRRPNAGQVEVRPTELHGERIRRAESTRGIMAGGARHGAGARQAGVEEHLAAEIGELSSARIRRGAAERAGAEVVPRRRRCQRQGGRGQNHATGEAGADRWTRCHVWRAATESIQ
jgi:hypothetical protein